MIELLPIFPTMTLSLLAIFILLAVQHQLLGRFSRENWSRITRLFYGLIALIAVFIDTRLTGNVLFDLGSPVTAVVTGFAGPWIGFWIMVIQLCYLALSGVFSVVSAMTEVSSYLLSLLVVSYLFAGQRINRPGLRELVLLGAAAGVAEAVSFYVQLAGWPQMDGLKYKAFVLFAVQFFSTCFIGWLLKLQLRYFLADERSRNSLEVVAQRLGIVTLYADGLIRLTLKGRILDANPAYLQRTGYQLAELQQMSIYELDTHFSADEINTKIVAIKSQGKLMFETMHWAKNGKMWPVEITAAYAAEDGGCIYAFLRDITERKRNEHELEEKNRALRASLEQAVGALSTAMVHRDILTAGHEKRVSDLSVAIGKELGLDADRLDGLSLAAMVHDIGQIQTPAEILTRPRRLFPEEMALVRLHAEAGFNILKDIQFPWPIAEIVYQHHECMNGKGYPRGLTGDQILLEARILRVADCVEAVLSHRPFRRAYDVPYAMAMLRAGAGKEFDAEIANICITLFEQKGYQLTEFKAKESV